MSHFLFLQDLVTEGIRTGEIRNLDPPLLFCMLASSLSGLIARVSMTGDPAERRRSSTRGWTLSGAGWRQKKDTSRRTTSRRKKRKE